MSVEAETRNASKDMPKVPGGLPWLGHITKFAQNPYYFMRDAAKHGEVVSFTLLGSKIVLLTGDEASTFFYRASDEEVSQSEAYKLMTPIFGAGLVFDAPNAKKDEQLKMLMPSLRVEAMRTHSGKIVMEVEDMVKDWGDSGEIDLKAFMTQLTIQTASHCLLGKEFRYELSDEFADIYHDLELGIHPVAYHFPNLPLPRFKKRDAARARMEKLVGQIVEKRKKMKGENPSDMLQSLVEATYANGEKLTHNEITGMLIAAIFAGHHTSSGTAAWLLVELLRHPDLMRKATKELDDLLGPDGEVTFQALREMPTLENVLKEVLRLHPPLIMLLRKVLQPLQVRGYQLKPGDMICAAPPVSHRIAKYFPNPEVFDIERYSEGREEDRKGMTYQPFGGGKHKCTGNSFAQFQLKAIFAILLRRYEFELVGTPESYQDNYKEMIVQPLAPCRVRYKRRTDKMASTGPSAASVAASAPAAGCPMHQVALAPAECPTHVADDAKTEVAPAVSAAKPAVKTLKVVVDRTLCQGHAMCMGEDASRFSVDDNGLLTILREEVSAADEETVRKQIKYCPNQALSVVEVTS